MPGRSTEFSWSRMGAQGSPKDDEVYGKGNFVNMGDRHLMTQINRTPKVDRDARNYPSISPYSYVGNMYTQAIDPDGKNIYLITYATRPGDVGHTALAVDNYVIVNLKAANAGTEKPIFKKTGTVTIYDLGPGGVLKGGGVGGESNSPVKAGLSSTRAKYVTGTAKREDLTTKPTSAYADGKLPDGVIEFQTSPERDMYVDYMMRQYQTDNPNYSGVCNNCTDYADYGLQIGLDKKVDGTESKYGISFDTPNAMFNQAKKEKGANVLKDASDKTQKSTAESYTEEQE